MIMYLSCIFFALNFDFRPCLAQLFSIKFFASTRIVENINEILLQATRSDETLKKKELDIPYLEEAYISVHLNDYVLHHYFLQFSKPQNS